jgi:hypothetical protein
MGSHGSNKLIAMSVAMAAAGILACAAALFDVFIPQGSIVGLCIRMTLLGVAVAGGVVGYTWVCDKCESYLSGRLAPLSEASQSDHSDTATPAGAVNQRRTEPRVPDDARSIPDPQHPFFRGPYVLSLRGSVSAKHTTTSTAARTWHGQ